MTKTQKILLFLEKEGIIKKLNPELIEFYNSILDDDSFPEESFKNSLVQLNNWVYENYDYELEDFKNSEVVQKIVTIIKNLVINSTIEKNDYKLQIEIVMKFKNSNLESKNLHEEILNFVNNWKQNKLNSQQILNNDQNSNNYQQMSNNGQNSNNYQQMPNNGQNSNNYQQMPNNGQNFNNYQQNLNNNMYANEASKYADEVNNSQDLRDLSSYAPPYFVGIGTRFAAWVINCITSFTMVAPILSLVFLFQSSTTVAGKMFGYKYVKRDTGEHLTVVEVLLYYLTQMVVGFICVFTLGIFWIIDIVTIRTKNGTYAEKWAGIKKVSVK